MDGWVVRRGMGRGAQACRNGWTWVDGGGRDRQAEMYGRVWGTEASKKGCLGGQMQVDEKGRVGLGGERQAGGNGQLGCGGRQM